MSQKFAINKPPLIIFSTNSKYRISKKFHVKNQIQDVSSGKQTFLLGFTLACVNNFRDMQAAFV